jgi:hypothetical protein
MRNPFLAVCFAGLLAVTTCQAIDLTPHFVTRVTGAGSLRIPFFLEGTTRYTFDLPQDVTISEEAGGVSFVFNRLEGASFIIKPSPFTPAQEFGAPGFEKQALASLPPGADEILSQPGKATPLSFTGAKFQGFAYSFRLPGRRFIQAVSFVNYSNDQQVMLIVTATAGGFDQALSISNQMLHSWRKVLPGEDLSAIPAN